MILQSAAIVNDLIMRFAAAISTDFGGNLHARIMLLAFLRNSLTQQAELAAAAAADHSDQAGGLR